MTAPEPFLPWSRPVIGTEEIEEVVDTLTSGWLTHGPKATQFENMVREDLGVQDTFAVTSCTAALHLAYLAAGIGPGDEVVTPALTFCAAPNALRQIGARPVFVDVDPVTFNLDPALVEAALTPRTRAIVAMHYGGHPCDLTALRALADNAGILLIEDAAHALHASRDGHRAGSVGDLATFSFYANKVITTGEGGILAGRADLVARARLLGRHGIDSSVWQRHGNGTTADYEVTVPGLKYVMPDILAAIGIHQYAKLPAFTRRRAQIAATYTAAIADLAGLTTPTTLPGTEPGWFLYSIHIDPAHAPLDRDRLSTVLRETYSIGTSQHFRPVHTLALFRDPKLRLTVTETAAARQLSLPCNPSMSDQDTERVITALRMIWNEPSAR